MPCFLEVVVEARLGIAAAAEQKAGGSKKGFKRHDVPGVFGDDVGGEEMDFARQIGHGASSGTAVGVEMVESVGDLGGALDLNPPERGVGVERTARMAAVDRSMAAEQGTVGGGGLDGGLSGNIALFGARWADPFCDSLVRVSCISVPCASLAYDCGSCVFLAGAAAGACEPARIEDDIVTFTVTERLGDSEAESGGFQGEGEFGKFSAALGDEFALIGGKDRGLLLGHRSGRCQD